MGTFGTNRIYTVSRVVKVEDLMRFGGWLRAGSILSISQMQNSSWNYKIGEFLTEGTHIKPLSMSDMILKFFFIALNSKTEWTLQSLPTEIVNKNMERFNLHLHPSRT